MQCQTIGVALAPGTSASFTAERTPAPLKATSRQRYGPTCDGLNESLNDGHAAGNKCSDKEILIGFWFSARVRRNMIQGIISVLSLFFDLRNSRALWFEWILYLPLLYTVQPTHSESIHTFITDITRLCYMVRFFYFLTVQGWYIVLTVNIIVYTPLAVTDFYFEWICKFIRYCCLFLIGWWK